jgi:hypothetical protein
LTYVSKSTVLGKLPLTLQNIEGGARKPIEAALDVIHGRSDSFPEEDNVRLSLIVDHYKEDKHAGTRKKGLLYTLGSLVAAFAICAGGIYSCRNEIKEMGKPAVESSPPIAKPDIIPPKPKTYEEIQTEHLRNIFTKFSHDWEKVRGELDKSIKSLEKSAEDDENLNKHLKNLDGLRDELDKAKDDPKKQKEIIGRINEEYIAIGKIQDTAYKPLNPNESTTDMFRSFMERKRTQHNAYHIRPFDAKFNEVTGDSNYLTPKTGYAVELDFNGAMYKGGSRHFTSHLADLVLGNKPQMFSISREQLGKDLEAKIKAISEKDGLHRVRFDLSVPHITHGFDQPKDIKCKDGTLETELKVRFSEDMPDGIYEFTLSTFDKDGTISIFNIPVKVGNPRLMIWETKQRMLIKEYISN